MRKIVMLLSIVLLSTSCINLAGETVKIIGVNGKVKVLRFDANVTEIRLTKTIYKISKIEGLSRFKNLKKLFIEFSDLRKTDFSFLEGIGGLQFLQFNFADLKDLSFINRIPSLVVFSCFETVDIDNLEIVDLKQNRKLEYFGVALDNVDDLPRIINIPESLKYIDLDYTNFSKMSLSNLSLLASYKNVYYIFSDDIEDCIKKMKLDMNLYDSSKYNELLKHYEVL